MEYLEEVDRNNQVTGKVFPKEEFHRKGMWYREVIGLVINEKKEILLQKRSTHKKDKPGLWEVCYGHVSTGETPAEAMQRELKEEIDLKVEEENLIPLGIEKTEEIDSYHHRYHRAFSYLFLIRTKKPIRDFTLQKEEVSQIKYISLQDLQKMLIEQKEILAFADFAFIAKIIKDIESMI